MVENRPFHTFLTHAILILGVALVLFPVWIAFVASTHSSFRLNSGIAPFWPGGEFWTNYGLILSDWNMAPMTGLELLQQVRADPLAKATPFVMVTAETKTENVVAARQAGANNYIIKPFNLAVLKAKLTSVLGEL